MHNTGNLNFGGCIALHGGEQHATKRVAKGVSEAAFKRLHDDLGGVAAHGLDFNDAGLEKSVQHVVPCQSNRLAGVELNDQALVDLG